MLDLTQKVHDYNGDIIKINVANTSPKAKKEFKEIALTLQKALMESLINQRPDQKCNLKCKLRRHNLYKIVHDNDSIKLKRKDKKFIKQLVSERYDVRFTGIICDLLDNK